MIGAIKSDMAQGKVERIVADKLALAGEDVTRLGSLLTLSTSNAKLKLTGKHIKEIGLSEFSTQLDHELRGYRIASFNLPAGGYTLAGERYQVCIGAGACLALCYAMQGRYSMSTAQAPRVINHQVMLRIHRENPHTVFNLSGVLDTLIKTLPKSVGLVRLHDSGDFFSSWYLSAWLRAIRANPTLWFYLYTKSHHLLNVEILPRNLSVIRSFGGRYDAEIKAGKHAHARIFKSVKELDAAGYINANDPTAGEIAAILGHKRIGLAYHGTRNVTDKQIKAVQ